MKFLARHKLLIIPLALAAFIRVVYWLQVKDEAWFLAPGTDSEFYFRWARDILNGKASNYFPFPRAPLYAYLLAGVQAIFGEHWVWPRLMNLIADTATVVLLFKLGKQLQNDFTGFFAASLWAIAGSAVYFSGEILMTSLACLLLTAFMYSSLPNPKSHGMKRVVLSGIFLALLCLLRPNFLLFVPLNVAVLFWFGMKKHQAIKTTATYIAAHLAVVFLVLSPVIVTNYLASHELIPVSVQGGVNFYIGNARGASGWSSVLPGASSTWDEEDARRIASEHAGRILSHSESSTEYWKMGWEEISADPVDWIRLMGKKFLLFISIQEIGNNRPLSLAWNSSIMLKLLRWLSLGLFLPFAVIGWITNRRQDSFKILALFALFFSASILIFFINSRYRLPLMTMSAVFAASGIVWFINNWKDLAREKFATVTFIIVAMVAYVPWYSNTGEQPAQIEFFAGNAALRQNRTTEALAHFQNALALNPNTPNLNLNIGVIYLNLGDTTKARDSFLRELAFNQQNSEALNNLGVIAEQCGEFSDAEDYYRKAYDLNPASEDHQINLWRILMKQGDDLLSANHLEEAYLFYADATRLGFSDARAWYKMAVIRYSLGDVQTTVELLNNALQADRNYIPARQMLEVINSAG